MYSNEWMKQNDVEERILIESTKDSHHLYILSLDEFDSVPHWIAGMILVHQIPIKQVWVLEQAIDWSRKLIRGWGGQDSGRKEVLEPWKGFNIYERTWLQLRKPFPHKIKTNLSRHNFLPKKKSMYLPLLPLVWVITLLSPRNLLWIEPLEIGYIRQWLIVNWASSWLSPAREH